MKIRSAFPENGCLIFLVDGKKQKKTKQKTNKKKQKKTYTLPPHRRLRKKVILKTAPLSCCTN